MSKIFWHPNPIIYQSDNITIRWYGILFALGLIFAGLYVWLRFKKKHYPSDYFETLAIWMFFGIFIGARLCHCIFYEPEYYLSHPIEMLFPIRQMPDMTWKFIGYYGLASHGGAFGMIIAVLCFKIQKRVSILPIMDDLAISVPLAGTFIRLGNLFNSEIVGTPTDLPWGIIFNAIDMTPRHPAQLYESIFYFILFITLAFMMYKMQYTRVKPGLYLSISFLAIAIFRFFIEFVKEVQVPFEQNMQLNMGQWLSLPFILAGLIILYTTQHKSS